MAHSQKAVHCSVLTVFPQLYDPFLSTSIIARARERALVTFDIDSFFSFVDPGTRIDAPTFGHGPGMLIKPTVVEQAISAKEAKHGSAVRVFFSPHGQLLDQKLLQELAKQVEVKKHLLLAAARYEGMDARVEEEYADFTISIGNFVLMGGDVPAMLLLEGFLRLVPGLIGKQESVKNDSFTGAFTDYPEYTEPVLWRNHAVPDIVRSGDHKKLHAWRMAQAARRTVQHHFSWLRRHQLSSEEKQLVQQIVPPHYVALLHNDIVVDTNGRIGNTSVTSMDIHDIARSSKTYGVKNFFLVTELVDQQRVATMLLDFWQQGEGISYNQNRHEALKSTMVTPTLDDVISAITQKEGQKPLLVATSARIHEKNKEKLISYSEQAKLWSAKQPILLLFGTGKGMAQSVLERADFLLPPLNGLTDFNHLSVRSAVAVILDRLIGI
jgi:tRNA (guanine37-N1)-methyltransferase